MSKGEPNEETLAHRIFSVSHVLKCRLLVVDFLILSHIGFIAEVVEVASIGLGVKLWDERSALRADSVPVDLSEVLVGVDILD